MHTYVYKQWVCRWLIAKINYIRRHLSA
jgi:hypothetical protein